MPTPRARPPAFTLSTQPGNVRLKGEVRIEDAERRTPERPRWRKRAFEARIGSSSYSRIT